MELWAWSSLPLGALLLLVIVCWARGAERPSVSELLVVLALGALALSAYRNVAPAMLALAATAVTILARTLREPDPPTEPQSSPAVRRGAWALTGAAGAIAVALAVTTPSPVDPEMVPSRLLDRVAEAGDQRMLTTYNVSGPLLWFGGPPPGVLVSVDGRADRYGADYLSRYAEMEAGAPGWEDLVEELRPTAALLREDRALAELLVSQRGWVEVDRQGDFVLLRSPGAPGWASVQPAT